MSRRVGDLSLVVIAEQSHEKWSRDIVLRWTLAGSVPDASLAEFDRAPAYPNRVIVFEGRTAS